MVNVLVVVGVVLALAVAFFLIIHFLREKLLQNHVLANLISPTFYYIFFTQYIVGFSFLAITLIPVTGTFVQLTVKRDVLIALAIALGVVNIIYGALWLLQFARNPPMINPGEIT